MQRGGRSSPCCLQAVTVWIRALQPPLTITDAPPKHRRGPFPDALAALHRPEFRLSPSLAAALISAENSFIFSPRQTLCAEEFALNFVTAESCGAHAHRCHWRARVQRVKGVQRGEVGGSEGDTKVTFLLIVWTK